MSTHAQAATCPPFKESLRVKIASTPTQLRVDNTLNVKELRQKYPNDLAQDRHAVGLTKYTLGYHLNTLYAVVPVQEGGFCVYTVEVGLTIGFNEMVVYIANEYKTGSCQYNAVRNHEKEHVRINETSLRDHMPKLRDLVVNTANRLRPAHTMEPSAMQKLFDQKLKEQMEMGFHALEKRLHDRHSSIDTRKSYDDTQKLCPSW